MWLSSHSWGYVTGWRYSSGSGDWYWYGDLDIDPNEDYHFGFYAPILSAAPDAPVFGAFVPGDRLRAVIGGEAASEVLGMERGGRSEPELIEKPVGQVPPRFLSRGSR